MFWPEASYFVLFAPMAAFLILRRPVCSAGRSRYGHRRAAIAASSCGCPRWHGSGRASSGFAGVCRNRAGSRLGWPRFVRFAAGRGALRRQCRHAVFHLGDLRRRSQCGARLCRHAVARSRRVFRHRRLRRCLNQQASAGRRLDYARSRRGRVGRHGNAHRPDGVADQAGAVAPRHGGRGPGAMGHGDQMAVAHRRR